MPKPVCNILNLSEPCLVIYVVLIKNFWRLVWLPLHLAQIVWCKWLHIRVVIRIPCNWSVVNQIFDFTQQGIMSFDVQVLFLHNTVHGLTNNRVIFSHTLPWCDSATGLKCQSTFLCNIVFWRSSVDYIHVWFQQVHVQHQRKLVPLSERIFLTCSLLAIKRRKAFV